MGIVKGNNDSDSNAPSGSSDSAPAADGSTDSPATDNNPARQAPTTTSDETGPPEPKKARISTETKNTDSGKETSINKYDKWNVGAFYVRQGSESSKRAVIAGDRTLLETDDPSHLRSVLSALQEQSISHKRVLRIGEQRLNLGETLYTDNPVSLSDKTPEYAKIKRDVSELFKSKFDDTKIQGRDGEFMLRRGDSSYYFSPSTKLANIFDVDLDRNYLPTELTNEQELPATLRSRVS